MGYCACAYILRDQTISTWLEAAWVAVLGRWNLISSLIYLCMEWALKWKRFFWCQACYLMISCLFQRLGRQTCADSRYSWWMAKSTSHLALFRAHLQLSWYHGSDAWGRQKIHYSRQGEYEKSLTYGANYHDRCYTTLTTHNGSLVLGLLHTHNLLYAAHLNNTDLHFFMVCFLQFVVDFTNALLPVFNLFIYYLSRF